MRRAILLSLGLLCPIQAFLGNWKIWSPVQTGRMAVLRSGQTVLAATTGGVVEWNPSTSTGSVHTGLNKLSTLTLASLVADSSGGIWAIGVDGHVSVLPAGASFWEDAGSYPSSGWTFTPGAATYWKGYLVLGGPQGLSLFSTTDRIAVDNISTFGSMTDTVTSVMANNDTLWVSLPGGLAFAHDSVWKTDSADSHIGKAGYYLTANRWTVRNAASRAQYVLLQDSSSGVHLGLAGQWSDLAHGLRIDYDTLKWSGGSAVVPGARHAISTDWGYFVSSASEGLVQVAQDGTVHVLHPDGALPDALPYSVAMSSNETLYHLTGSSSTRVWRRASGATSWTADTISVATSGTRPVWNYSYDVATARKVFTVGPKGELVVGAWGDDGSHGGFLVSQAPGSWTQWNRTNDTSFHLTVSSSDSTEYGVVCTSVHPGESGVWGSTLVSSNVGPIFYFPSSSTSTPLGLSIDATQINVMDQMTVNDLLPVGSDLWLATYTGLVKVPNVAPSNPPQVATGLLYWAKSFNGTTSAALSLNRLAMFKLQNKTWILGAGNGYMGVIPAGATASDTFYTTSDVTLSYTALAVDAQKQIWAAGNKGIDIFTLALNDAGIPAFTYVRRVTQADGLPDNQVNDLQLDSATGKAIIATSTALCLWTSPYRPVQSRLSSKTIKVWPNPVRLRQNKTLFVDGATSMAQFNLFAADGTLVLHKDRNQSTYGLFQIELPSTAKLRPGVYYWSLKDDNGSVHGPLLIGE